MLQIKTVITLLLIFVLAGMMSSAWAQNQNNVFSVAYYVGGAGRPSSAPAVDGKLQIVYPGASSTAAGQYICADIYVFDPGQELKECCSCPVSTDGLLTIPLHSLTDNPANGVFSPTGVIKLVADSSGVCLSGGLPTNPVPKPELRAWSINVDTSVTEDKFQATPLSSQELFDLGFLCSGVPNESGPGVCRCS
jgi:hypothetical protein